MHPRPSPLKTEREPPQRARNQERHQRKCQPHSSKPRQGPGSLTHAQQRHTAHSDTHKHHAWKRQKKKHCKTLSAPGGHKPHTAPRRRQLTPAGHDKLLTLARATHEGGRTSIAPGRAAVYAHPRLMPQEIYGSHCALMFYGRMVDHGDILQIR